MKTTIKKSATTALVHLSLLLFTFLALSAHADVPASAYVQDGLVVCFDGIENAGAGQHSSDLTEWVNLATADGRCGNAYPSDGSYTVTADSISFVKGRMVASNLVCATSSTPITLQARARATSAPSTAYDLMYVNVSSRGGVGFDARTNNGYSYYQPSSSSWGSQKSIYKWWGKFSFAARAYDNHTVTAIVPVSSDKTASVGKVYQENTVQTYGSNWESAAQPAPNGTVYVGHTGVDYEMYSVRIYNRELTTAEIAYNELVDRIRFEGLEGYRWNADAACLECRVDLTAIADEGGFTATVDEAAAEVVDGVLWAKFDGTVALTPVPESGKRYLQWAGDLGGLTVDGSGVASFQCSAPRALRCEFIGESSSGVSRAWSGPAKGLWSDPANWTPNGVPAAEDAVTIPGGATPVVDASTPQLTSFTMEGGTLTFTNWTTCLSAKRVSINAGTVTCAGPFNDTFDMSNRVWFAVSDAFTLAAGAKIDVSEKGYGTATNVPSGRSGMGPSKCSWDSGASYGSQTIGGNGYGDPAAPMDPGTSGGSRAGGTKLEPGGGAIFIEAPTALVTVNGSMLADGVAVPTGVVVPRPAARSTSARNDSSRRARRSARRAATAPLAPMRPRADASQSPTIPRCSRRATSIPRRSFPPPAARSAITGRCRTGMLLLAPDPGLRTPDAGRGRVRCT